MPEILSDGAETDARTTCDDRSFSAGYWPNVPASYIFCREDRTVRPEWARKAARERLGVAVIELPGGHRPACFPARRVGRRVGWASMTATERALREVHALFK